ncbi:single-stranded DNA-binding protein [Abiotrophia defectiva]|uniref:single-stranded DNA-binding protein n=1 Tax=Abiotrophia defectiva TaxID=46125 RepID=UPI0026F05A6D|nr:single-stranded DNA-binding protein [Abiotrophia defectiva]
MNTVQLVGRLTRDVELRFTSSGTAVGSFTIAVNRNFTNQQGEREADFISCVIWRKAAENLANFTRKGSLIAIDGRLQTRSYDNQQGQRVYVTEVVVNNFDLLESRSVTEQRPVSSPNTNHQTGAYGAGGGQGYQSQPQMNQNNYNQSFSSSSTSPFMDEGHPIDISEDDLPF